MKKISFFIILICLFHAVGAKEKHKNTVKFYGNNFFYPEIYERQHIKQIIGSTPRNLVTFWQQLGLSYQRELNKRWSVEIAHYKWNNTALFNLDEPGGAVESSLTKDPTRIGIQYRNNLKFFDLAANYSVISTKKHLLRLGLGISYQKGFASYIDSVFYYNNPSYPHWQGYSHYEYHEYYGYIPSLSYDFIFLKEYACVGADIRARRYFNYGNYTQVDFGIHIGVKFGDPHFRKKQQPITK